jgi:folylpolyglutamate synthase
LRLSRKLPKRLKLLESNNNPRNIKLGLERVKRAVPQDQNWEGVHVAGTNGKGSICAYLSGLFTLAGKSYGRFTSPAFPEKRHGVVINGEVVRQGMYDHEMAAVLNRYDKILKGFEVTSNQYPGPLTPFEVETATAYRIFNQLRVRYGIVEVGMGGSTDATNVMTRKAVTVISKIGMDHAEYLGRNLKDIASKKAGIMARDVPCVVDHTNEPEVMEVLQHHAWKTASPLILSSTGRDFLTTLDNNTWQLEDWQQQNLLCAVTAFNTMFPRTELDLNRLMEMNPTLPGRMQTVRISTLHQDGSEMTALVDGAHNPLATQKLGRYVDKNLRADDQAVTWVIGFSQSDTKPFKQMLQDILRPQDNVAFVEFQQQANEPPPVPAVSGRLWAQECLDQTESPQLAPAGTSLEEALEWARQKSEGKRPVVITGSLYLMRDLLNLPNVTGDSRASKTRRIGSTAFKSLRKKKAKDGLPSEKLEQYLRAKHEVFDPRDKARLLRRNKRREQTPAIDEQELDEALDTLKPSEEEHGTRIEQVEEVSDLGSSSPGSAREAARTLEVQASKTIEKKKQTLYTPFWRDPDNPSMSLPDPSGKPSRRALKREAAAKKAKLLEEKARLEEAAGFDVVNDIRDVEDVKDPSQADTLEGPRVDREAAVAEKDPVVSTEGFAERWAKIAERRLKH